MTLVKEHYVGMLLSSVISTHVYLTLPFLLSHKMFGKPGRNSSKTIFLLSQLVFCLFFSTVVCFAQNIICPLLLLPSLTSPSALSLMFFSSCCIELSNNCHQQTWRPHPFILHCFSLSLSTSVNIFCSLLSEMLPSLAPER